MKMLILITLHTLDPSVCITRRFLDSENLAGLRLLYKAKSFKSVDLLQVTQT